MSDYKGPFTWDWTMDEHRVVVDHDGNAVPLKTVLEILNAHARQSAQRCETCRYAGEPQPIDGMRLCVQPDIEHAQGELTGTGAYIPLEVNGQPYGCTAHQPKEQA